MKVEKIITISEELEITGAALLSVEEAEELPERLRKYSNRWWLRSPGFYQGYSNCVNFDGLIRYGGDLVSYDDECVRPALNINLKSSNLQIGDCFLFGNEAFEVVSQSLAFCKSDIGNHCFREDWGAEDSNDYEKSDVKRYVEEWFENAKKVKGIEK